MFEYSRWNLNVFYLGIHAELCVLARGMFGRGRWLGPTRLSFMVYRGLAATVIELAVPVGLYADWL